MCFETLRRFILQSLGLRLPMYIYMYSLKSVVQIYSLQSKINLRFEMGHAAFRELSLSL